jgi:hypothetical protein
VRVSVSTEGDISMASSYTHCKAQPFVDEDHGVTITSASVEWMETDQEDDEGETTRRIDTAGEVEL